MEFEAVLQGLNSLKADLKSILSKETPIPKKSVWPRLAPIVKSLVHHGTIPYYPTTFEQHLAGTSYSYTRLAFSPVTALFLCTTLEQLITLIAHGNHLFVHLLKQSFVKDPYLLTLISDQAILLEI